MELARDPEVDPDMQPTETMVKMFSVMCDRLFDGRGIGFERRISHSKRGGGEGYGFGVCFLPYSKIHLGGSVSKLPFTLMFRSFAQRYPHMGPNFVR